MQLDPSALIDRSIADLETLATFLAAELQRSEPQEARSTRELRRKEVLLTISVLLPKLAEVRRLEPGQFAVRRACDTCGDD